MLSEYFGAMWVCYLKLKPPSRLQEKLSAKFHTPKLHICFIQSQQPTQDNSYKKNNNFDLTLFLNFVIKTSVITRGGIGGINGACKLKIAQYCVIIKLIVNVDNYSS